MKTIVQQAIFSISATIVFSLTYFIVMDWLKRNKNADRGSRTEALFLFKKVLGCLLLGVVPAVTAWGIFRFSPVQAGLHWKEAESVWLMTAGASIFFILLNLLNSRSAKLRTMYPELRTREWGFERLLIVWGGWALYLTGYEYLFRGLLLFSCYEAFGAWPAVAINLTLYFALHLPKGMKEAVATIPFGALICYLTLESQSILPAIFIHAIQAISCETACIWRNPEMKFKFIK